MELIRKFYVVIGIVAVVLILVVLRTAGDNFKPDAAKWAQPSWSRENIVTPGNLEHNGDLLVIRLDENVSSLQIPGGEYLKIAPGSILDKQNIKRIKSHKGQVLLASSDPALSSGIWMILSQMGMNHVFILSENDTNEVIKSEFRPDTLIRPEL